MQGATVVIMALANEVVAAFAIKDPIKLEAGAVIKALKKAGIKAGLFVLRSLSLDIYEYSPRSCPLQNGRL